MSCDNVPTTAEIEQAKKDVTDFNTFMTSTSDTFADSKNVSRLTLQGATNKFGFGIADFTFAEGGTLLDRNLLVSNDPVDGFLYRYVSTGTFPITVTAGTNPVGDPDWEAFTATSAEFISNANGGSVQDFIDSTDVLNGKILSTTAYVESYKTPTNSDTDAIDAAMSASKHVIFAPRKYTYTKELVTAGHTLEGAVSETFSGTGTIIEFDIPSTPSSGFAFRNILNKSYFRNIKFIQKDWSIPLNGFKPERLVDTENVDFSYFNGHGCVLVSTDSLGQMCYSSSLKNLTCDYNAKHGIVLGGAANAVVIDNPKCRWNGSPSYGVAPTAAGLYDGLYSGGKNSEYPGNPGTFNDPQGVVLIGGDYSYNSRTGLNLDRFFEGVVVGGYSEVNLYKDLVVKEMYGSNIVNFMSQGAPLIEVPETDSLSVITLLSYPNKISVRGADYGDGNNTSLIPYSGRINGLKFSGSDGTIFIGGNAKGGIQARRAGGAASIQVELDRVGVTSRSAAFGAGAIAGYAAPEDQFTVVSNSAENVVMAQFLSGSQATRFFRASGSDPSSAATAMSIQASSITGRSINAGGTVNTSGADYAEYMIKSDSCGEIKKGDICGVDEKGKLTDKFDDAVSFVIKSTNPSFVGGDSWFNEQPPEAPIDDKGSYDFSCHEYIASMADYNKRMDIAHQRVDRIAFCGQVPCNVFEAKVGDYIIPTRSQYGSIEGAAISSPDFEQYKKSIAKVWAIGEDGKAWVVIKTV